MRIRINGQDYIMHLRLVGSCKFIDEDKTNILFSDIPHSQSQQGEQLRLENMRLIDRMNKLDKRIKYLKLEAMKAQVFLHKIVSAKGV